MGKRIILPYDVGAIIYLSTERRLQCRYFEQGKGGVGTFRGMQCVREELGETVIITCNLSSNPSRSARPLFLGGPQKSTNLDFFSLNCDI